MKPYKFIRKLHIYFGVKASMFLVIFIFMFNITQHTFVPKWYYPSADSVSRVITGFYEEPSNTIDVLTLGTSHMALGFSPLEVYEQYGITSYNLATLSQPIQASYYLLKEAFNSQTPTFVIFDVSSLFYKFPNTDMASWRYVLDQMPFNQNKYDLALEYSKQSADNSILDVMFPIIKYHSRWDQLVKRDFTDFFRNKHFYSKGYYMAAEQTPCDVTVEYMNEIAHELININQKNVQMYSYNEYSEHSESADSYNINIPKENISWLLKMRDLCKENNCHLILTKIPTVGSPVYNQSAWTLYKYNIMQDLCENYSLTYVDLLYDINTGIDWNFDTIDGGKHLNFSGAKKISSALGTYMNENFAFSSRHLDAWEQDLISYNVLRNAAQLILENNFIEYINLISKEDSNYSIFIAASDDIIDGLNNNDKDSLRQLGLQTDFNGVSYGSYIAIIENQTVVYESFSNKRQEVSRQSDYYPYTYSLTSSGYMDGSNASIFINDVNYAVNRRGLNIVIYDTEHNCVIDSVCFDTASIDHAVTRNNGLTKNYFQFLETCIIEGRRNNFL